MANPLCKLKPHGFPRLSNPLHPHRTFRGKARRMTSDNKQEHDHKTKVYHALSMTTLLVNARDGLPPFTIRFMPERVLVGNVDDNAEGLEAGVTGSRQVLSSKHIMNPHTQGLKHFRT